MEVHDKITGKQVPVIITDSVTIDVSAKPVMLYLIGPVPITPAYPEDKSHPGCSWRYENEVEVIE